MTLENTLRQQLSNPEAGGFHVQEGDWSVTLVAESRDSLSCALRELTLQMNTEAQGWPSLSVWAQRVAQSATGLLEPLRVIEVDVPLGKALLRSDAPTTKDDKAFYYELLLTRNDRTSATLRRYAGQIGDSREAVPFVLTHDAIVKLVTDITTP